MRSLTITDTALTSAKKFDPSITKKDIAFYVDNATVCTHPKGNRRYQEWVFKVEKGRVSQATKNGKGEKQGKFGAGCDACDRTGESKVFEACPMCDGMGCRYCGGEGGKLITIPCQYCSYHLTYQRK